MNRADTSATPPEPGSPVAYRDPARVAARQRLARRNALIGLLSLAVFVCLYLLLLVLDIWLMRRYAKLDPPELDRDETGETPLPAIGY